MKQIYPIVRVEFNAIYIDTQVIYCYESKEKAEEEMPKIIEDDFNYLVDDIKKEGQSLKDFVNEHFIDKDTWRYDNGITSVSYEIHTGLVLK